MRTFLLRKSLLTPASLSKTPHGSAQTAPQQWQALGGAVLTLFGPQDQITPTLSGRAGLSSDGLVKVGNTIGVRGIKSPGGGLVTVMMAVVCVSPAQLAR